ncbi:Penicillin-binding protein 2 [Salmonella enterica subsp. enterica]|uniref:Penicillin-binding protein 2 n=1 Tax=Salmonella enterica I TaxID=59201 RepID=A0A379WSR8_SALET|nr:Penicillin-binding protein 2 [Salmonella enterica subsp. enterica]
MTHFYREMEHLLPVLALTARIIRRRIVQVQVMTFKDFDAEEKLFLRRVIVAFGVVVVCFGILIFNLYNLQIRQHHYYTTRSNENDIKMLPVAPTRGIIYDRNGIPLVRNVTWYDIAVTPYKIADMDALLKQLTPIVDLSPMISPTFAMR